MAQQRIYVGNLPFSARESDVQQLFAAYGEVVSVALITDRETGQPRGFGFVEMSVQDATKAIAALNGRDFGGRSLNVSIARERSERPGGNFSGGRSGYGAGGGEPRRYGGYGAQRGWAGSRR